MFDDICYLEGNINPCCLSFDLGPNQPDCIQACMIWRESDAVVTKALQNADFFFFRQQTLVGTCLNHTYAAARP